ncbi:threonine aldolase family protein [uncultured Methylobacterium sp.]|uniref:threonine aldolase family protein n=1 Tax=uncultured Methylobacterium sp. TaxID=157278 RepID=UPI0035CBA57D
MQPQDRPEAEHDGGAVDLRSDTVTRPTAAMYDRMRLAPIGDDGLDGDPTARALEAAAAAALGKEAGLFVPSCTMANLLATLAQVQRNQQVVLEAQAHMYTAERGAATFTGAFHVGIPGIDGAMDLDRLEDALDGSGTRLQTGLIGLETSHNNAGGTVLALDHMRTAHELGRSRGIPVHLDGARLFNAAVYLGVAPQAIARHADTVSLCLSKGLSAPVGAILAGPRAVVDHARRLRRMLGGTQRQVGIMAAAGLEAIEVMGDRLAEDHARARLLSAGLNALHPNLRASCAQTNIVQVDLSRTGRSSADWVTALAGAGLLVRPLGRDRLRCVTHRHIDGAAVSAALRAFRVCLDAIP